VPRILCTPSRVVRTTRPRRAPTATRANPAYRLPWPGPPFASRVHAFVVKRCSSPPSARRLQKAPYHSSYAYTRRRHLLEPHRPAIGALRGARPLDLQHGCSTTLALPLDPAGAQVVECCLGFHRASLEAQVQRSLPPCSVGCACCRCFRPNPGHNRSLSSLWSSPATSPAKDAGEPSKFRPDRRRPCSRTQLQGLVSSQGLLCKLRVYL
jgi:hypothetical protein